MPVVLAALLTIGALLAEALALPTVAVAAGGPPSCTYGDVLTAPRSYVDWPVTLLDTTLGLPASYVPPDLVPVSTAGIAGSGAVRAVVIDDLRAMARAAAAAGNPIAVTSAYRSYASQAAVLQRWIDAAGYASAILHAARPGHSEHQLGVAIDFRSAGSGRGAGEDWGRTPAGAWMRTHAWQYGFVQSYPGAGRSTTCYAYEAWHFRYVGRELAARIHGSRLTVREFLWTVGTGAVAPAIGGGRPVRPEPRAGGSSPVDPSRSASPVASGAHAGVRQAAPPGDPPLVGDTSASLGPVTSSRSGLLPSVTLAAVVALILARRVRRGVARA